MSTELVVVKILPWKQDFRVLIYSTNKVVSKFNLIVGCQVQSCMVPIRCMCERRQIFEKLSISCELDMKIYAEFSFTKFLLNLLCIF